MTDFPGEYFKLVNLEIISKVDAALRPLDLTCAQSDLLLFLKEHEQDETTIQDIGEHFHLKHPTIVGIIHRLESKGFVETTVSTRDRRCRIVHLTEKYTEVHRVMSEMRQTLDSCSSQGFSDEELLLLRQFLQRIYRNLSQA